MLPRLQIQTDSPPHEDNPKLKHQLHRNRLPSLYSDFTLQKKTNPDGYAVNVSAWEQALLRAAKRGYTSTRGVRVRSGSITSQKNGAPQKKKKTDHLILRTDESLLRDLETPEFGRPVGLGAVFVGFIVTGYRERAI